MNGTSESHEAADALLETFAPPAGAAFSQRGVPKDRKSGGTPLHHGTLVDGDGQEQHAAPTVEINLPGSERHTADHQYLTTHEVASILGSFTSVLLEAKPSDVVRFMGEWASARLEGKPGDVVKWDPSMEFAASSKVRSSMFGRLDEGLLQPASRPTQFYTSSYAPDLTVEALQGFLVGLTVPAADAIALGAKAMRSLIRSMDRFLDASVLDSPLHRTYAGAVFAYTCELYDAEPEWGVGEDHVLDVEASFLLEEAYSSPARPVPLTEADLHPYREHLRSKDWRARHFAALCTHLAEVLGEAGHPELFADCGWNPRGGFQEGEPSVSSAMRILRRLEAQEPLSLLGLDFLADFSIGDERLLLLSPPPDGSIWQACPLGRLLRRTRAAEEQLYRQMNQAMRDNRGIDRWRYLIHCLDKALSSLPSPTAGQVYRGVGLHFDVTGDYRETAVVCWPAFSSSSASQEVADDFIKQNTQTGELRDGTVFIIRPQRCKDVSMWSRFPREKEYLFPSNCRFKVMKNLGSATQKIIDLSSQIMELEEVVSNQIEAMELQDLVKKSPSTIKSAVSKIAEETEAILVMPEILHSCTVEERAILAHVAAIRLPSWSAVDFGQNVFADLEGKFFAETIVHNVEVQQLHLKAVEFADPALAMLLDAIATGNHCTRLSLTGRLVAPCIATLAARLLGPKSPTAVPDGRVNPLALTHLSFANCQLSSSAVLQVLQSIPGCRTLRDVDLSGNAAVHAKDRTAALDALVDCGRPLQVALATPASGEKLRTFGRMKSEVMSVAIHTASCRVAFALKDGTNRIHDMTTGTLLAEFVREDRSLVSFSPCGEHFLSVSGVMGVGVRCFGPQLEERWSVVYYGTKPRQVAWRRDQQGEFAVANAGGEVLLLSPTTLPGGTNQYGNEEVENSTSVAYSPCAPLLAIASKREKKVFCVSRPPAAGKRRSLDVTQEPMQVDFSIDGAWLLVGTSMFVLVVDTQTLGRVLEFGFGCCGPSVRPMAAFTPDGQYLAVYSPFTSPKCLSFWHLQQSVRSPLVEVQRKGTRVKVHSGVKGMEIKVPDLSNMALGADMQHVCLALANEVAVWSVLSRRADFFICCGKVVAGRPTCDHFSDLTP